MHYVAIAKLPLFWISGRETCSLAASVGAGGGWLLSSSGIAEMERGNATLSDPIKRCSLVLYPAVCRLVVPPWVVQATLRPYHHQTTFFSRKEGGARIVCRLPSNFMRIFNACALCPPLRNVDLQGAF